MMDYDSRAQDAAECGIELEPEDDSTLWAQTFGCDCCGRTIGHQDGCPATPDPEYDAWAAEMEAEEELLRATPRLKGVPAISLDAMCDGPCQAVKPVLYGRTCYTIGWAGHPGAEQTTFGFCAECL